MGEWKMDAGVKYVSVRRCVDVEEGVGKRVLWCVVVVIYHCLGLCLNGVDILLVSFQKKDGWGFY